ncbi:coiled-coil domain-containing protein 40 [Tachyglossus aculeatus]|uniref:coiled-coil domain-containing protein 40 n=1 Tax=Tachyglossus aculeatus TaxID=9261 RepID=UPI0018F76F22|nr:coiled-coil domain-containing protein 40 [Tachyglossus aculeatus]
MAQPAEDRSGPEMETGSISEEEEPRAEDGGLERNGVKKEEEEANSIEAGEEASLMQPSGEDVDSTQPPGEEVDSTQPPAEEVDSTQPPAEEVDSTQSPTAEVDSTQPLGEEVDSTQPPEEEFDSTQPPAEEVDSTQPPAEEADSTQPLGEEVDSTQAPAEEVDLTQPPGEEVDSTQPPAEEVDSTQPPEEEVDSTQPPEEEVDLTQPPEEEVDSTQPAEEEVDSTQPPGEEADLTQPVGEVSALPQPLSPSTVDQVEVDVSRTTRPSPGSGISDALSSEKAKENDFSQKPQDGEQREWTGRGVLSSSEASSETSPSTLRANIMEEIGDISEIRSPSFLEALNQLMRDERDFKEEEPSLEKNEEEEEEEAQLVVLDPDHPLMTRFQAALGDYLRRQIDRLQVELRELVAATRQGGARREELGVSLYGIQQHLARLQKDLDGHRDRFTVVASHRRRAEERLAEVRLLYNRTTARAGEEHHRVSALQTELENLSLRLFYLQNMDQDIRDDISVMRRVAKKSEMDQVRAQVEKKKQDLYVDQLTRQSNQLEEQIALYEAQFIAQAEDTRVIRQAVAEASLEIETINLEKKQLVNQWSSSLVGMKRRDEAFTAVREALRLSRCQAKSADAEIEGFKKSIMKEEERNELLARILNRSETDAATSQKLIAQCLAKQQALKNEFSTFSHILHDTEGLLSHTYSDRSACMNDISILQQSMEKELGAKKEMENVIVEKLQDQMTSSKMAKYFAQLNSKLQKKKTDLVTHLSKIGGDIAQATLGTTQTRGRVATLKKRLSEVEKDTKRVNELINNSENEISRSNLLIARKQGIINLYNKKVEAIVSQLGGEELGPLEIEIKRQTKQMEEYSSEVLALQMSWLQLQDELVKLTQEREDQLGSVDLFKKQITILEQKKLRTEKKIDQEKAERKDIEHHMRSLGTAMKKLNLLICQNSSSSEELQQGNTITENEFVRSLKVSEREALEMQEKLSQLQDEKEQLLNNLVEVEQQIMLWEKKIQLAKEMRAVVDSDTGQGEIRGMKAEIHRMQVRHAQLMKQQEKMIRDMEVAVARRETILIRAEGQKKVDRKQLTRSDFHHKQLELRRKIKETQQNAEECNRTLVELEKAQESLKGTILAGQVELSSLQADSDILEADIDHFLDQKRQNLSEIVTLQRRQKWFQAVKEGRYSFRYRAEQVIQAEKQRLTGRISSVSSIVDHLKQEYPQYQGALHPVSAALENQPWTPGSR